MKRTYSAFRFLSTPYGLFVHFGILLVATLLLLYKPVIRFRAIEAFPELLSSTSPQIKPLIEGKKIPQIEVGFALENFAEFDITNNMFVAEGMIWFLFNPKEISLEKVGSFAFDKGALLEKSAPLIKTIDSNKILARFYIRFSFTTNLNYRKFPIDDHRIYIVLKNDQILLDDAQFISSNHNFSQSVDAEEEGWMLVNSHVITGYNKIVFKENNDSDSLYAPRVVFILDYDRSGFHLLAVMIMPLILLFFAALCVFLVRVPITYDASNTFMGSIFALIGYLFVVETISPQVGYMMLSNMLYFSTLFCTFIVATLGWASDRLTLLQRGLVGTFIEFFFLALLFYFIYFW